MQAICQVPVNNHTWLFPNSDDNTWIFPKSQMITHVTHRTHCTEHLFKRPTEKESLLLFMPLSSLAWKRIIFFPAALKNHAWLFLNPEMITHGYLLAPHRIYPCDMEFVKAAFLSSASKSQRFDHAWTWDSSISLSIYCIQLNVLSSAFQCSMLTTINKLNTRTKNVVLIESKKKSTCNIEQRHEMR